LCFFLMSIVFPGGQPPFELLVIPVSEGASPDTRGANRALVQPNGTIRNISIPVSAFDSGSKNGSYVLQQLPLPQGSQLMLSMSDAMGIFSGGTSALMTVGASQTQQACNTTDPGRRHTPSEYQNIGLLTFVQDPIFIFPWIRLWPNAGK
jgi:hypothetical protein